MSDRAAARPVDRRTGLLVFAVHAVVFATLIAWSWRKWPDPIVDFGRELYVPWQITRGNVLYRDIASLFGPLSPYVNALWFRLFGVSLTTLVALNLAIFASTLWGIYYLLAVSTDRIAAAAATLVALLLCGFSQYLDVGNYNFATPYSHEATHGLALSVAALAAWFQAMSRPRPWRFALSGVCFGLVLLTKPEASLAASGAILMAAIAAASLGTPDRRALARGAAPFAAGALVGPLAFFGLFHVVGGMSIGEAARSTANGWLIALSTSIAKNPFYLRVSGFDAPARNILRMAAIFAGTVAVIGAAVALATRQPDSRSKRLLVPGAQAILLVIAALAFPAFQVTRTLPLFALTAIVWASLTLARERTNRDVARRSIPLLMWSTFALILLGKMLLNAQIYHYGFYLALPALSVAVVVLVALVPRVIPPIAQVDARRARLMMLAIVAVAVVPDLALASLTYRAKVLPVASGSDRFLTADTAAFWQGRALRDALEWIDRNASPGATLAVVPEGVMINYLSRRVTPVPYINFMPPELIAFGERTILAALDEHPPDFVLLVHRNTKEYGYPAFGADPAYGRDIMTWVDRHYAVAHTIGRDPMTASGYGIEIRRRMRD